MPAGTHAHELSMVLSALYPELDMKRAGATQILGHYLYWKLSMKESRTIPFPALPDTIGTNVWLNAAKTIYINDRTTNPPLDETSFFDLFNGQASSFRQDSGSMNLFAKRVINCGYTTTPDSKLPKTMMASEIENTKSIVEAIGAGYKLFGAGGFYGDSAKVWTNEKANSNSMAVKAIRVVTKSRDYSLLKKGEAFDATFPVFTTHLCGNYTVDWTAYNAPGVVEYAFAFPIKIGDKDKNICDASSKLAIDKNASPEVIKIKTSYAQTVQNIYYTEDPHAVCKIDTNNFTLIINGDSFTIVERPGADALPPPPPTRTPGGGNRKRNTRKRARKITRKRARKYNASTRKKRGTRRH